MLSDSLLTFPNNWYNMNNNSQYTIKCSLKKCLIKIIFIKKPQQLWAELATAARKESGKR